MFIRTIIFTVLFSSLSCGVFQNIRDRIASYNTIVVNGAYSISECTRSKLGTLYYVTSESSFYYCNSVKNVKLNFSSPVDQYSCMSYSDEYKKQKMHYIFCKEGTMMTMGEQGDKVCMVATRKDSNIILMSCSDGLICIQTGEGEKKCFISKETQDI